MSLVIMRYFEEKKLQFSNKKLLKKVEWESGPSGEGKCEYQEGDANFKSFPSLLR